MVCHCLGHTIPRWIFDSSSIICFTFIFCIYRLLKFKSSLRNLSVWLFSLTYCYQIPLVPLTWQVDGTWSLIRKNTKGWNHSGFLNNSYLNEVTFFSESASESPSSDFVKHTKMLQTHLPVAKGIQAVKSVLQLPRCTFSLSICSWHCWRQRPSLGGLTACPKIVALVISPLLCQMSSSLCVKKSLVLEASEAISKSCFL